MLGIVSVSWGWLNEGYCLLRQDPTAGRFHSDVKLDPAVINIMQKFGRGPLEEGRGAGVKSASPGSL